MVISLAFRERVLDVANTTPERTRAVLIDECTYTHDTFPLSPWRAMQLKDRKEDCDNVSEIRALINDDDTCPLRCGIRNV